MTEICQEVLSNYLQKDPLCSVELEVDPEYEHEISLYSPASRLWNETWTPLLANSLASEHSLDQISEHLDQAWTRHYLAAVQFFDQLDSFLDHCKLYYHP